MAITYDGHRAGIEPNESGRKWHAVCECGYQSTNRMTQESAIGAVIHHVTAARRARMKAAAEARRNGVSTTVSHPPSTLVPGT